VEVGNIEISFLILISHPSPLQSQESPGYAQHDDHVDLATAPKFLISTHLISISSSPHNTSHQLTFGGFFTSSFFASFSVMTTLSTFNDFSYSTPKHNYELMIHGGRVWIYLSFALAAADFGEDCISYFDGISLLIFDVA
jgi:hypothetical protein